MRHIFLAIVFLLSSITISANSIDFAKSFSNLAETNNGNWTDVKMPVVLTLNSPKKISISGIATIVNNESLFMSLRFMGFEVVQLKLTRDSLVAVDKFNKRYVAEETTGLLNGVNLTIGNLQRLLLGQLFVPGSDNLCADNYYDFSAMSAGNDMPDMWVLSSQVSAGTHVANCSWVVDGYESPSLSGMLVSVPEINREAMIFYRKTTESNAGKLASVTAISSEWGNNHIDAEISWDFNKAKWNTRQNPVVKIPKGAKRISGSQLLSIIERL